MPAPTPSSPAPYAPSFNIAQPASYGYSLLEPYLLTIPLGTQAHRNKRSRLSLYTISLLPIVYGVCHTKERSRGGRILHSSRAIVLQ